jgi:hypothetical protein
VVIPVFLLARVDGLEAPAETRAEMEISRSNVRIWNREKDVRCPEQFASRTPDGLGAQGFDIHRSS